MMTTAASTNNTTSSSKIQTYIPSLISLVALVFAFIPDLPTIIKGYLWHAIETLTKPTAIAISDTSYVQPTTSDCSLTPVVSYISEIGSSLATKFQIKLVLLVSIVILLAFDMKQKLDLHGIDRSKDVIIYCIHRMLVRITPCLLPFIILVCSNERAWLMYIAYAIEMIYNIYAGYNESISKSKTEGGKKYDVLSNLLMICCNKPLLGYEMVLYSYAGFYGGKIVQKYLGGINNTDAAATPTTATPIDNTDTAHSSTDAAAASTPLTYGHYDHNRTRYRPTNNSNNTSANNIAARTTPTNHIDVLVHDDACAICHEQNTGDNLSVLPCRHAFHCNCMLQHAQYSYTVSCPICRLMILSTDDSELVGYDEEEFERDDEVESNERNEAAWDEVEFDDVGSDDSTNYDLAAGEVEEEEEDVGGGALTASDLASASPEMQKNMIGEKLYPLVHKSMPYLAGKITGMFLEIDNSELLYLLESPEALHDKIDEALAVLGLCRR